MARGIMYYANLSGRALDDFDESDFYGYLDMLQCDSVADQDPEDAAESIAKLLDALGPAFAPFVSRSDLPEKCSFALSMPDGAATGEAKRAWFGQKLEKLRELAAAMSVDDFIEPAGTYRLQALIDDDYDAAVYLDMGTGPATYTLMGFLRRLSPGVTYYFSENTVHMH